MGGVMIAAWGATGIGLGRPLTALRHRRWHQAAAKVDTAVRAVLSDPDNRQARADARRAVLRRDAISEIEPTCPTWAGDRLRAVADRVHHNTGLDLTTTWPRLWLVLPDAARLEVTTIQERCASTARTPVWGVAYLAVGAYWWPALLPGLWLLSVSRHRIRRSVGVYADLVESSIDMYSRDVAKQLGFELNGPADPGDRQADHRGISEDTNHNQQTQRSDSPCRWWRRRRRLALWAPKLPSGLDRGSADHSVMVCDGTAPNSRHFHVWRAGQRAVITCCQRDYCGVDQAQ